MAEQFGFGEIGGDGPTIDADERPRAARRGAMDRVGENFLADAALAFDQDRCLGRGGADRYADRLAEGGCRSDNLGEIERLGPFFGKRAQFAGLPLRGGGIVERGEQPAGGDRLDHHVARPGPHRPHGEVDRMLGRDDDDRQFGEAAPKLGDRPDRIFARRPDVDQRDIQTQFACADPLGGGDVGRAQHAPTGALRERADQPGLRGLAIDQQKPWRAVATHPRLPFGYFLSIQMLSKFKPGRALISALSIWP